MPKCIAYKEEDMPTCMEFEEEEEEDTHSRAQGSLANSQNSVPEFNHHTNSLYFQQSLFIFNKVFSFSTKSLYFQQSHPLISNVRRPVSR
jgi:hypothetical protein